MNDLLKQGIAAAKAGTKARACRLLNEVVQADPQNETAWLWLSGVVETDEQQIVCLENVLAINPDNQLARRGLGSLRAKMKIRPLPPMPVEAPASPAPVVEVSEPMASPGMEQRTALPEIAGIVFILTCLFWGFVATVQLITALFAEANFIYLAAWNGFITIYNLSLVVHIFKRHNKAVGEATLLGVVGIVWGIIQLLNGVFLQVFVIPLYAVGGVLVYMGREEFVVGRISPEERKKARRRSLKLFGIALLIIFICVALAAGIVILDKAR